MEIDRITRSAWYGVAAFVTPCVPIQTTRHPLEQGIAASIVPERTAPSDTVCHPASFCTVIERSTIGVTSPNGVIDAVRNQKGTILSVVPRRKRLEDLFVETIKPRSGGMQAATEEKTR